MWSSISSFLKGNQPPVRGVYVHFGGKKLAVSFGNEDFDVEGKRVSLGHLRQLLARRFNIRQPSELVLFTTNPQRKLQDDSKTIDAYGLANGAELMAVHEPPKEPSASDKVQAVLDSVENELGDRRRAFVAKPPADPEARQKEHRVLSETALAKMLQLDDVNVGNDEDARQARKQAINTLHKFHSEVDEAYKRADLDLAPKATTTAAPEQAEGAANNPGRSGSSGDNPGSSASRSKRKGKKGKGRK